MKISTTPPDWKSASARNAAESAVAILADLFPHADQNKLLEAVYAIVQSADFRARAEVSFATRVVEDE